MCAYSVECTNFFGTLVSKLSFEDLLLFAFAKKFTCEDESDTPLSSHSYSHTCLCSEIFMCYLNSGLNLLFVGECFPTKLSQGGCQLTSEGTPVISIISTPFSFPHLQLAYGIDSILSPAAHHYCHFSLYTSLHVYNAECTIPPVCYKRWVLSKFMF